MEYKKFPPDLWHKIQNRIDEVKSSRKKVFAAFDADGTLWDTDLGETFFKWQIQNKVLSGLPSHPWEHYRKWKESGDPRPAYLWLAQINQGRSITEVKEWARENVKSFKPLPIFSEQKRLIEILHKHGVEVFVVTASVKWAVEPGAELLGIENDHVLGVTTKIENGFVTNIQEKEITWREGKATAILRETNGTKPFLCSGNTTGDSALLEIATDFSIAVGACKPDHELFPSEEKLRQEAQRKGWTIHQF